MLPPRHALAPSPETQIGSTPFHSFTFVFVCVCIYKSSFVGLNILKSRASEDNESVSLYAFSKEYHEPLERLTTSVGGPYSEAFQMTKVNKSKQRLY